ncbi:hypothetical protein Btru_062420 [Bulinus truncatus]|nr:hypothetical protein Btru_062420 [Bulinus truncatus]
MEERDDVRNNTHVLMNLNESPLSSTNFPAWGPAVTVAAAMLIFLAASFYIRHRKVVKKREILMDYFYIIFQYGGLRRKRMVAALCNTNAITLRELGRSFMISFDSIANSDNSCPFYLEDSSFGQGGPSMTPGANKKTFFRNRGMISAKKARGPFRRYNTQSDDSPSLNPVSLQDILMRFKTKRATTTTSPNPGQSSGYHRHGKLEGSSMCAIHGDDLEYPSYIEENEEPRYKRQRRNAYVAHVDSPGPRFADIVTEVGRRSLGNVMPSGEAMRSSPYPGKRNSEPWHNLEGGCSCLEHPHDAAHHSRVFQLNGERLSPSNFVCGSHGYIPKLSQAGSLGGSCCSYRNSEPTILIHPASTDVDPTQGWTDIRNRYTNGIVFLKKVPKGDGSTGEFYYEEQREPSVDLARRASLSKVSYVPSGNMNDYYNCLSSPKKTTSDPPIGTATTTTKSPTRKIINLEPVKSKRSRLSLGEIAVSNFNRRIEIVSESLQESSAHESSLESKGSQDSTVNPQHSKYKSTWLKFKNVFTGSRSTTHSSKSSKSTSLIEDRQRRRGRRQDSRWKRFFSVLTGFRSLPESKVTSRSLDCPKCSVSVPSGLDYHTKCHSMDIESGLGLLDLTMSRTSLHEDKCNDCSDSAASARPKSLKLQCQTRSVPEELSKLRHQYQLLKTTPECKRPSQEISALIARRYRKRLDPKEASSLSLPLSRKDFGTCSSKSGMTFTLDPTNKLRDMEHCHETCMLNSGKSFQQAGSLGEGSTDRNYFSRRFRNLSPLPETCIGGSCKNDGLCPHADGDTISERSIYLTPSHFINEKNFEFDKEFNFNLLDNTDLRRHYCSKSSECLNKLENSATNFRKVSSDTHLVHVTRKQLTSGGFRLSNNELDTRVTISNEYSNINFYSSVNISSDIQISSFPRNNQSDYSSSNLNLEQRLLGLSNETVYFDSISALGTPGAMSPLEPKNVLSGATTSLPLGAVTPLDSESLSYFESNHKINSQENMSSELISPSPNPSQLSSPFVSRSPSPCQFWPTTPQPFSYANYSQLAIPTPTRSAFIGSPMTDKSHDRSNILGVTSKVPVPLTAIGDGLISLGLTPNNQLTGNIDTDQLTAGEETKSDKLSELNLSSKLSRIVDTKATGTASANDKGQMTSNDRKQVRGECDLLCDLEDKQLTHQPSPGGSRNPTPTRSFSTPSPTLDKPSNHQSASPDEIYRANVSRLPRFARRASQGTAVPFVQHQDLITARMANERNPPLRESSTETSLSYSALPVSMATSNGDLANG